MRREDRARRDLGQVGDPWLPGDRWYHLAQVLWVYWHPHASWTHCFIRWIDPGLGVVLDRIAGEAQAMMQDTLRDLQSGQDAPQETRGTGGKERG